MKNGEDYDYLLRAYHRILKESQERKRLLLLSEQRANDLNERLNTVILENITTKNDLGVMRLRYEKKVASELGFIELSQKLQKRINEMEKAAERVDEAWIDCITENERLRKVLAEIDPKLLTTVDQSSSKE